MADKARAKRGLKSIPLSVRALLWIVKTVSYITRRSDGTVNRRLLNFFEHRVPAKEIPSHGVYSRDAVVDHETGVWVRLYIPVEADGGTNGDKTFPNGEETFPVVVHFHGGGFCTLSAAGVGYDLFCRRLARRVKAVVVSVEYRLAPEHKYPAAYEDAYVALTWLGREGRAFLPGNADVSRCFLIGDSAGGNIVHHVGCRVAEGKEDLRPLVIRGHVILQPYFGGEERTAAEINLAGIAPLVTMENSDWYWRAFLPVGATKDHPAANVVGPHANDIWGIKLPPSMVVIGGLDMLQDWQMRYVEHLKAKGKEAEVVRYDGEDGGVHAFHVFPGLPLVKRLLDDVDHFMQRVSSRTE